MGSRVRVSSAPQWREEMGNKAFELVAHFFYNAIQIFQELPTIFEVSGRFSVGADFLHSSFFGAVAFFGSSSKTKSLNFHCPISFKYAKIEAK